MANWFDNGIKRNTGIPLYFTEIANVYPGQFVNHYIIKRVGSEIFIPITRQTAGFYNPDYTFDETLVFMTSQGTKITSQLNTLHYTNNGFYNDKDAPMIFKTNTEYTNEGYPAHESNDNVIDGSKTYDNNIQVFDTERGIWGDKVALSGGGFIGSALSICTGRIHDDVPPALVWQHSSSWNNNAERAFLYTKKMSDGYYLRCSFVNEPENSRIVLYPLGFGFVENNMMSPASIISYTVDVVVKSYPILTIPYSILNDAEYFDPEEDSTTERPEEDLPDWDNDNTGPGGGGGNYINYPSDDVPFPELPTISAIDTGFLTMYNPSSAQLQSLVSYLWTSDWVDNIQKMVSNPMDAIIGLNLVPYDTGTIAASVCKIGAISTGINMNLVTEQYKILDCGSVTVPEHWGNALDYNNVNISIALPFVGIRSLDTNLVMNSTVSLKYYVDLLTGSAIAMLEISKSNTSKSVYYNFECNLNYQIPVTGANYAETIKALMSTVSSGIGLASSAATSNAAGALSSATNMVASAFMAGSGAHHYESSGNLSANIGILGQFQPYIIVELPKQSLPANFKKNKGYTSNITASLGSLSGYTEASYFHLDGIPATDQEKNLIDNALRNGVIL